MRYIIFILLVFFVKAENIIITPKGKYNFEGYQLIEDNYYGKTYKKVQVKGLVLDESKKKISDVYVFIKGTQIKTKTNKNGEFSFSIIPNSYRLLLTFKKKGYLKSYYFLDVFSKNKNIQVSLYKKYLGLDKTNSLIKIRFFNKLLRKVKIKKGNFQKFFWKNKVLNVFTNKVWTNLFIKFGKDKEGKLDLYSIKNGILFYEIILGIETSINLSFKKNKKIKIQKAEKNYKINGIKSYLPKISIIPLYEKVNIGNRAVISGYWRKNEKLFPLSFERLQTKNEVVLIINKNNILYINQKKLNKYKSAYYTKLAPGYYIILGYKKIKLSINKQVPIYKKSLTFMRGVFIINKGLLLLEI